MRRIRRVSVGVCLVWSFAMAGCFGDREAAKRHHFEAGNRFFNEGKYKEAIIEYRNAIKRDSRFGEARSKLAEAYLAVNNVEAAFREIVRAADLQPNQRRVQLRAGEMLLLAGRFTDAKAIAEKLLNGNIKDADAQVLLGYALAGLKDVPAAIAEIEKGIDETTDRFAAYSNLGNLQIANGDLPRAEAAFKNAVAVAPKSPRAHLGLAGFYWSTRHADKAERSLKTAHRLAPENADVNRVLATFYLSQRRPAEAESHLKTLAANAKIPAAKLDLADYYVATGRPSEAIPVLMSVVDHKDVGTSAQARMAALAYADGERSKAHRIIKGILQSSPRNARALMLKARFHLVERDLDSSLVAAKAAVAAEPNSPDALHTLGLVHAQLDDSGEASKAFGEAIRLNPNFVDAQLELARLSLARGDAETAVKLARTVVEKQRSHREARLVVARGLLMRGDLFAAEREGASLVREFPDWALSHVQHGLTLMRRGNSAAARTAFERAIELDRTSMEALSGVTMLDVAMKRTADAIKRLDKRLGAEPKNSEVLGLAGDVYFLSGDSARAEQSWQDALDANPSYLTAYDRLGQLYVKQNKLQQALTKFEVITKERPKSVAAHTMVAYILQVQNDLTRAKQQYERVLQMDPNAAVAANNMAWMHAEQGENLDVALQLAQTAKRQLPEQPEVSDTLAWVYYKKGLANLAIPPLQTCVQKDPKNPIYHYHLGLAYAKVGDKKQARASLEQALAIRNDFDGAAEARRVLASL